MARKTSTGNRSTPSTPTITPEDGIRILQRQIDQGQQLLQAESLSKHDFDAWRTLSEQCVIKAFGDGSEGHYKITGAHPPIRMIMAGHEPSAADSQNRRKQHLEMQLSALTTLVPLLELEIELDAPKAVGMSVDQVLNRNDVFIVHGHDGSALSSVARFLERLRLTPIILHEQANEGRTVIEKFVHHADTAFAVVLLTPDDRGGLASEPFEAQAPRARQNVILELGFFLGKLGRSRVCALYKHGVEIPSDYHGVAFIPLDEAGAWRLLLAKELRAAKFEIDMNLAI